MSSARCFFNSSCVRRSASLRTFQFLSVTGSNLLTHQSSPVHFKYLPSRKFTQFSEPSPETKTFSSSSFGWLKRSALALPFGLYWARCYITGVSKMHSEKCVIEFPNVKIVGIPAIHDNYMFLVIEKASQQAIVIDPVEPEVILNEARKENVTLNAILTTHHHWDHASGNPEMVSKYKRECPNVVLKVYGGDDRVDGLTDKIGNGDKISLGSLTFHCLHTPCHTSGHICYYLESKDPSQKPVVFTGDTLFIAGCGRFFEGTPEQMHGALVEKLGTLPPETLVCNAHEYTVNNLRFALSVEPNNEKIKEKLAWAEEKRKQRLPTFPSTIAEEKDINPFMRCVLGNMQQSVGTKSSVECIGKLRSLKDNFKA